MKTFGINLTEDEHRQIKAAAAAAGWNLGPLLRRLLELWLSGKVKVGPPPK